ncbi:MAG: hypothetical protein ACOCRX_05465 [Candidatus Woesearchaeota archaeon]
MSECINCRLEKINKETLKNVCCNFKPKNSEYENLPSTMNLITRIIKDCNDYEFLKNLVIYLRKEKDLKLITSILTVEILDKYRNTKYIEEIICECFDKPELFSFTLEYMKEKYHLNSINQINPDFKKILKQKFEKIDSNKIKKLKNRKVKTKDIIKTLHPQPKNQELSELYKKIIES